MSDMTEYSKDNKLVAVVMNSGFISFMESSALLDEDLMKELAD